MEEEDEEYFSNGGSFSYERLSSPGLPPKELESDLDSDIDLTQGFESDVPGLTRSLSGSSSSTTSDGPASPVDEDFSVQST